MDDWDLNYYTDMFSLNIKRNPTNVECFDLAQSNSEHSRHWFFKGRMVVDGKEHEESLFKMVTNTQEHTNPNSVLAFCDNSR
jgi:phosphoribosylformylglycinamidine synthase